MLFPEPRTPSMHLANAAAPVVLGLLYAVVALNAVTGCGQGGECLTIADFLPAPTGDPIAVIAEAGNPATVGGVSMIGR